MIKLPAAKKKIAKTEHPKKRLTLYGFRLSNQNYILK
jgi:hypothetical protein